MIEIQIKPFLEVQDSLVQLSVMIHSDAYRDDGLSATTRERFSEILRPLLKQLEAAEFEMCRLGLQRLLSELVRTGDTKRIVSVVDDLRRRLLDQADSLYCFSLSSRDRALYEPKHPLFGEVVEAKLPEMSEDISEAGKCLAVGRPTAAVFHLMRVMELSVQTLGDELGIPLVEEKNWQNILDEVNKAIQARNHKEPRTKALAAIALHLYGVKVAWRNEVMHPKQTYTLEQATEIFSHTRVFVGELAGYL